MGSVSSAVKIFKGSICNIKNTNLATRLKILHFNAFMFFLRDTRKGQKSCCRCIRQLHSKSNNLTFIHTQPFAGCAEMREGKQGMNIFLRRSVLSFGSLHNYSCHFLNTIIWMLFRKDCLKVCSIIQIFKWSLCYTSLYEVRLFNPPLSVAIDTFIIRCIWKKTKQPPKNIWHAFW